MDNDIAITQEDQAHIDKMVASYRHSLENLYRLAHIQGAMEQVEKDRDELKRKAAA